MQNFTFILEWGKGLVHWRSTHGAGHIPGIFSLHAAVPAPTSWEGCINKTAQLVCNRRCIFQLGSAETSKPRDFNFWSIASIVVRAVIVFRLFSIPAQIAPKRCVRPPIVFCSLPLALFWRILDRWLWGGSPVREVIDVWLYYIRWQWRVSLGVKMTISVTRQVGKRGRWVQFDHMT